MKYLYSILFLSLFLISGYAQTPKREMRATWLATVWSLDWPSTKITETGNSAQIKAQKDQMIRILDNLASVNINAVFFQVRSRCDAMYKSSYEPWSSDLVSERGKDPGYDPLAFVVEEAHKRGIEVHAWMNPYRFSTASTYWDGQAGDYRETHPEWILTYPVQDGKYNAIMNPALPEVRQRITDIVREVVTNYDVDGVVFDDYFYAYGGTPADLDADAQQKYKPEDMSLGDWRRENINKMVASVYNMIQKEKPYVTFGVSPFGIWTTNNDVAQKEGIVLPQGITGGNMYEEIYCDPVAWLKEGTVDYISPQLYWTTTAVGQDYDVLCPWWSELAFRFKKHFYSSHSISGIQSSSYTRSVVEDIVKIGEEKVSLSILSAMERGIWEQNNQMNTVQTRASFGPEEIGLQIERNRLSTLDGAPGSVFYSTKYIYNVKGVMPYLKNYCFMEKALVPAIDWKNASSVSSVSSITLNERILQWNSSNKNVRYTVYAVPKDKVTDLDAFNSSRYLLGVSYTNSFEIPESIDLNTVTFAVAVFDRYGNEYTPILIDKEQVEGVVANLIYPVSGDQIMAPFRFKWEPVSADWYTLQIAEDQEFSVLHSSKDVVANELFTDKIAILESGKTYYWRVVSHKAGHKDAISEIRQFTPMTFSVTSPSMGSTNIELTPVVSWSAFGKSDMEYTVLVASAYTFTDKVIVYSEKVVGKNSLKIPVGTLLPVTIYYVKIKALQDGEEVETAVVTFTTEMVFPDIPIIVSPVNEGTLSGESMVIEWKDNIYATGFQAHLSKEATFPVRGTTSKTTGAFEYRTDFGTLAVGTYYTRVRAKYKDGQTEWSPVVKFHWGGATSITSEQDVKKVSVLGMGTHQILKINAGINGGILSASLFDIVGNERKVFSQNQEIDNTAEISLELGDLPKGVYLLRVDLNGQLWTLKLLN